MIGTEARKPQQPASFSSQHHGKRFYGQLCVTLHPPSSPSITHLEALANDPSFEYNAHPKLSRTSATSSSQGKRKSRSSSGILAAAERTLNGHARGMLRTWGFDLVVLGIGSKGSRSSPAPLSALVQHATPHLHDGAMLDTFHDAALRVDKLLGAVRRARTWSPERRLALIEQAGGTLADVQGLESYFGKDVAADFVIISKQEIGDGSAEIDTREVPFNACLNNTVVSAVNAVLSLIGMAQAAHEDMPDGEETDETAAAALLRAIRWQLSGRSLRLIDTGSGRGLRELPREMTRTVKPDWLLVSGINDDVAVHGVIESKPNADPSSLIDITARRVSPLAANEKAALEAETEPQQSPPRPRKQPRRKSQPAPRSLREPSEPPKQAAEEQSTVDQPFRWSHYGYVDSEQHQRLALQLASQMLAFEVRHALLWGNWGHDLVPVQLAPTKWEGSPAHGDASGQPRQFALVYAPEALDVVAVHNPGAPFESNPASSSEHADSSTTTPSALRFHGAPNVIVGIVRWALHAQADGARREPLLPNGTPRPWRTEATDPESSDEGGEGGGQAGKGKDTGGKGKGKDTGGKGKGRARGEGGGRIARDGGGPAPSDAKDKQVDGTMPASSSCESMAAGSVFSESGAPHSSPPSSPVSGSHTSPGKATAPGQVGVGRQSMRVLPFASGTFADVHRGSIQRRGEAKQTCVVKVNRQTSSSSAHSYGTGTSEDEEEGGPQGRFERERDALQALAALQGTVVPRLLGTWKLLDRGEEMPPALLLEDVGEPIDELGAWPASLAVNERRRLVEEAYERLHKAGWVHGDVAPRNILVSSSSRPKSEQEGDEAVARVCIVDLARAHRGGPQHVEAERAELRQVLDDVF